MVFDKDHHDPLEKDCELKILGKDEGIGPLTGKTAEEKPDDIEIDFVKRR